MCYMRVTEPLLVILHHLINKLLITFALNGCSNEKCNATREEENLCVVLSMGRCNAFLHSMLCISLWSCCAIENTDNWKVRAVALVLLKNGFAINTRFRVQWLWRSLMCPVIPLLTTKSDTSMYDKACVEYQLTRDSLVTHTFRIYTFLDGSSGYEKWQRTCSLKRYFLKLTSISHANLQRFYFVAESSKVRLTRGNVLLMHRWDVIIINDVTLVASATRDTRLGCKAGYKTTSELRMQSEAKWVASKRYSRLCSCHCSYCWCSPE
jgi:hypothetical protein